MKFILLIFIATNSLLSFAQQKQDDTIHVKTIKDERLKTFIDSLRTKILQDTTKFKRTDLLHTIIGTRNTKSYSPIFYIDNRYVYKLDIINGTLVKEFVDNLLDPSKISRIEIVDWVASQALFGINGMNGALIIITKKGQKIHYKVAGLTMNKKRKYGDNFHQRKDGEILVH